MSIQPLIDRSQLNSDITVGLGPTSIGSNGQVLTVVGGLTAWATSSSASLAGLTDVSLSSPGTGQVLTFNGTSWINQTPTNSGTVTSIAITGSTGLVVTGSPITTSGTLTFILGTELQGLSTLSTNGFVQRTGAGTYTSTALTSGQVTTALGFTPYNVTNPFGFITGNQTITLTGAVTGSGTTGITTTLAASGVTAGTYNNLTVNTKGLATAGSNIAYLTANQSITVSGDITGSGTTTIAATLATVNSNVGTFGSATAIPIFTVSGKGLITAASTVALTRPLFTTTTQGEVPASGGGTTNFLRADGTWSAPAGGGGGGGSVTSVAAIGSTGLVVTGSPITTSGTLTLTLGNELQALSGLGFTGIVNRTGAATYTAATTTTINTLIGYTPVAPGTVLATAGGALVGGGTITATPSTLTFTLSAFNGTVPGYVPTNSIVTTTKFLRDDGTWANPNFTTNLIGGAAGELPYQSAGSSTAFTAVGTAGQILVSGGTGAPTWATTTISSAGNVTIAAPSSGNTLTVTQTGVGLGILANQVSAQPAIVVNSTFGVSAGIEINQASAVQWNMYIPASSSDLRWTDQSADRMILNATSGNLSLTGSVTAASFSGSGTGLTGTAGSLTAGAANSLNMTQDVAGTAHDLVTASSPTNAQYSAGATLSSTGNLTITGKFQLSGSIVRQSTISGWLDGNYASIETGTTAGAIYSIGGGIYVPAAGTTNPLNNMYGIGYTTSSAISGPTGTTTISARTGAPIGWGMYVASNGAANIFLDADNGGGYFTGPIVASSFSGSGAGLTGTAGSLNIGGNAATATTASNGGVTSLAAGSGISLSATTGAITITSSGAVSSVTNGGQLTVSPTTGAVVVALPTNTSVQLGSLGVGTAASGTTGEIRATGNITAFFSDMRLKQVVGPLDNALGKINSLTGFKFKANKTAQDFGYDGEIIHVGLSAQEVREILPEIIKEAPVNAEYMTLDYAKLVPLLVEAIKELTIKVTKLENIK